jgi:hypothetical protein
MLWNASVDHERKAGSGKRETALNCMPCFVSCPHGTLWKAENAPAATFDLSTVPPAMPGEYAQDFDSGSEDADGDADMSEVSPAVIVCCIKRPSN